MATLSGIPIADKHSSFDAGVAFLLNRKSRFTTTPPIKLDSGWEVELKEGCSYVVARQQNISHEKDILVQGYEAIQIGLDLLAIQGKDALSTRNTNEEYIVWWRENLQQILKVCSNAHVNLDFTMTVEGEKIPEVTYHQSLRYFRNAQVTDDLFDAFRNLYLAFESLLDYIQPFKIYEKNFNKKNFGKGRKPSERDWIKETLKNFIVNYPGSEYLGKEDKVTDSIYDTRCSIFHGKGSHGKRGGKTLLPQNAQDRKSVEVCLGELRGLVLFLLKEALNTYSESSGNLHSSSFQKKIERLLPDPFLFVTDTPINSSADKSLTNKVVMQTKLDFNILPFGFCSVSGNMLFPSLQKLEKIVDIGLINSGLPILAHASLESEIVYDAIDELRAEFIVGISNSSSYKRFYRI